MEPLLSIVNLRKYYPILGGLLRRKIAEVKAVDGVTFDVMKGECFALVGESGCGKTTLAKTVLRLIPSTSGNAFFAVPSDEVNKIKELLNEGKTNPELKKLLAKYDILKFKGKRIKELRRKMQIVYQDPTTSLNPRMLVKDIVGEPLKVQGIAKGAEVTKRVIEVLEKVGLGERFLYRYPHEFSGGQRQRIAIARAIVTNPKFVVLDEPTSSVDVSVRAQLLNLFQELQKDLGLTYLFITHDLAIVECISQRVAVMYLGKIVEISETARLYKDPLHPYSKALLSSIPIPDPTRKRKRILLSGDVPSPINPPFGCRFHTRCPNAMDICKREEPPLVDVGGGHYVACHLVISKS